MFKKEFPFIDHGDGILRPMLNVNIINPFNDSWINAYGLIDTGADYCAIPALYAKYLGHSLLTPAGKTKTIITGNGQTVAYPHTSIIEIVDTFVKPIETRNIFYRHDIIPVDFMPNLSIVILGMNDFLSKFILMIDYPNKIFSLTIP